MRGGPAHAVIVSSAMFGTINGGPWLTYFQPEYLHSYDGKARFQRVFAGGVEAASSGGSIMPPVMGSSLYPASMTAVPYRDVIIAATLPAIAILCLFLSASFSLASRILRLLLTEEMYNKGGYIIFMPNTYHTAHPRTLQHRRT